MATRPLHKNNSEVKACRAIVVWCISALAKSDAFRAALPALRGERRVPQIYVLQQWLESGECEGLELDDDTVTS